jgi:hypothetical protein
VCIVEDMGIKDENFRKLARKAEKLEAQIGAHAMCKDAKKFATLYPMYKRKVAIKLEIAVLKKSIKGDCHTQKGGREVDDVRQSLCQVPELWADKGLRVQDGGVRGWGLRFAVRDRWRRVLCVCNNWAGASGMVFRQELKSMKRVLRRLQYCNAEDVVDMKGRAACGIDSGDELVLTELIFDGVFKELSPEVCAALLSCFVFDEKTDDDTANRSLLSLSLPPPPSLPPHHKPLSESKGGFILHVTRRRLVAKKLFDFSHPPLAAPPPPPSYLPLPPLPGCRMS